MQLYVARYAGLSPAAVAESIPALADGNLLGNTRRARSASWISGASPGSAGAICPTFPQLGRANGFGRLRAPGAGSGRMWEGALPETRGNSCRPASPAPASRSGPLPRVPSAAWICFSIFGLGFLEGLAGSFFHFDDVVAELLLTGSLILPTCWLNTACSNSGNHLAPREGRQRAAVVGGPGIVGVGFRDRGKISAAGELFFDSGPWQRFFFSKIFLVGRTGLESLCSGSEYGWL